jgi:hypothetical protein
VCAVFVALLKQTIFYNHVCVAAARLSGEPTFALVRLEMEFEDEVLVPVLLQTKLKMKIRRHKFWIEPLLHSRRESNTFYIAFNDTFSFPYFHCTMQFQSPA